MLYNDLFIKDFFSNLSSKNIDYVILRGYKCLPDFVSGDIDIVIQESEIVKFHHEALKIFSKFQFGIVQLLTRQYVIQYRIYNENDGFFQIDVHTGEAYFGLYFLNADEVLNSKIDFNGFFIASYEDQAFSAFISKLFYGNRIDEKYYELYNEYLFRASNIERFNILFGQDLSLKIKELFDLREYNNIIQIASKLKYKLFLNELKSKKLHVFKNIWKYIILNTKYYINPPGIECNISENLESYDFSPKIYNSNSKKDIFNTLRKAGLSINSKLEKIAIKDLQVLLKEKSHALSDRLTSKNFVISFLGPDGSGKSTIIELLKQDELIFKDTHYFHLKPRLLGAKGDGKPVVNPHGKPPYMGLLSYLKLVHFILDYILGYMVKILSLKSKSSLIIFDRYYDDLLVDPLRFRYGGSLKIAKFMRSIIPKPDIYFVLTTDPKIIFERKQEVTFDELERQIEVYNSFVDNKKYFKIDVSQMPEKIIEDIIDILSKELTSDK